MKTSNFKSINIPIIFCRFGDRIYVHNSSIIANAIINCETIDENSSIVLKFRKPLLSNAILHISNQYLHGSVTGSIETTDTKQYMAYITENYPSCVRQEMPVDGSLEKFCYDMSLICKDKLTRELTVSKHTATFIFTEFRSSNVREFIKVFLQNLPYTVVIKEATQKFTRTDIVSNNITICSRYTTITYNDILE